MKGIIIVLALAVLASCASKEQSNNQSVAEVCQFKASKMYPKLMHEQKTDQAETSSMEDLEKDFDIKKKRSQYIDQCISNFSGY